MAYVINVRNCHCKNVSEDRPWPIRDTLPEDSILRTFVDSLFEAGVILSFKKVLWTNPKTNL